jgi:hypothetical protein
MSRKPRVLQLWLSVIGVSGVVSIYAVAERWSTDVWAGLWMQLAFFGGVMAWVGWLLGRVYEQELSEAAQPMTEDERNRILMRLTLPRWRRVLGWVAIVVPGLLFWVLLFGAVHYGGGSGWAIFSACLLFLVLLRLGSTLSDWFWKPYRDVQADIDKSQGKA